MRSQENAKDVESILAAIRACFARLRVIAEALHRELGVTGAMRAILETLSQGREMTVPAIARSKRMSRQNIQVIVDGLVEAKLVELIANPGHKRSPLLGLTKHGRATFREMRLRERSVLKTLGAGLTPKAVKTTTETLAAIQRRLEKIESEQSTP
jgi:DNA-binding MarR family transcriptional regulator